jgi:NitT/TauT family transport system permease protein
MGGPLSRGLNAFFTGGARVLGAIPGRNLIRRILQYAIGAAAIALVGYAVVKGVSVAAHAMTFKMVAHVFFLGFLTLLRVAIMVVVATLIWTPIGVMIGFSPKLARIAQPLVQIGASFPANLLFPVVVIVFIAIHLSLNWGSVILIALGTQWYILFNVIAGASSVPNDLREVATVFRLDGWHLWQRLILPAIFPSWVTGALTAAGGAWNASIVAEVADSGSHHLVASGLGAYITDATTRGDWPAIIVGIGVMSLFVVALNRLVWRRLYSLGETRFNPG